MSSFLLVTAACERDDEVPLPMQEDVDPNVDLPRITATWDNTMPWLVTSNVDRHGDRLYCFAEHWGTFETRAYVLDTATLVAVDSFDFSPGSIAESDVFTKLLDNGTLVVSTRHATFGFDARDLASGPLWQLDDVGAAFLEAYYRDGILYAELDTAKSREISLVAIDVTDQSTREVFRFRDTTTINLHQGGGSAVAPVIAEALDGRETIYSLYRHIDTDRRKQMTDVLAHDLATGELLWHVPSDSFMTLPDSWCDVAAGLVVDSVLVVRTTREYHGLNRHTGEVIWSRNLIRDYGARDEFDRPVFYNTGSTPYEYRDGILVVNPTGGRPNVAGLDVFTGRELWRRENEISIGPRANVPYGPTDIINVSGASGVLQRYDAFTGELKWKVKSPLDSAGTYSDANFINALHVDPWGTMYSTDGYQVIKYKLEDAAW